VLAAALLCVPAMQEGAAPPAGAQQPPSALTAAADLPWLTDDGLVQPEPVAEGLPAEQPAVFEAAEPAPAGPVEAAAPAPVGAASAPTPELEERGRAALDALHYPWRELGYSIRFEPWRGGNLLGLTDSGSRTITMFVRPGQSDESLRVTLAHEVGHALDFVTGGDAQRRRYLELRGLSPDTPWYPCDGCSDYASPAGDWAEVFALWLMGPGDFRSQLAGPPDAATLERLQPLFAPPSYRRSAPAAPAAPAPAPKPSPTPTKRPVLTLVP
jgi:hypothetical protein